MIINCGYCEKNFNCSPSDFTRYQHHYCSRKCKHEAEQEFNPPILEFQTKLFEKPITELAKEFNVKLIGTNDGKIS